MFTHLISQVADEFSHDVLLLFVFQVWDHCFEFIRPLAYLLHFIFEILDMSLPRIFGHSIAPFRRTIFYATGEHR